MKRIIICLCMLIAVLCVPNTRIAALNGSDIMVDYEEPAQSGNSDFSDKLSYERISEEAADVKSAQIVPAPTGLSVHQASLNSVKLSWTGVDNAEYYELYRDINNEGMWKKVKNIYSEEGSNLNLSEGNSYSYKVRAVINRDTKIYGLFSDEVTVTIKEYKVTGLSVKQNSPHTVKINWNNVENVSRYELFRKIGENGQWNKVKNAESNTASNLNLSPGTTYYYKVRAYIITPSGGFYSNYSDEGSVAVTDTKPYGLTVSLWKSNSVRLEWNKVDGCDHYELFREINNIGIWNKVKNIYGETGSNLNLESGNHYAYKIRAVIVSGETVYTGEYSDEAAIDIEPNIKPPVIRHQQIGTNRIYIEWEPVKNADCYYLYRCDNGGKWVKVKSTSNTNVSNMALTDGVEYQYKVTAVCLNSYLEYESAPSNIINFSLGDGLERISDLKAEYLTDTRVSLSWNHIDNNAAGYVLYRRVEDGEWSRVKNVSGNSTNNLNLEEGIIYSYFIRSYGNNGQGTYYSLPSNTAVYWNQPMSELTVDNSGTAEWNKVKNADAYNIYINGSLADTVKETAYRLNSDFIGCTVSVSAVRNFLNGNVESLISNTVVYEQKNVTVYRALLIGETEYSPKLNGPDNDINFMNSMLNGLSNKFEVYAQQNATRDEVVDLINVIFSGATENDVSLFYYSGHGVTGLDEYYSGALQTIDYQYITTIDLAEMLSAIPGKVIVILDSCGSGAAISDGKGIELTASENIMLFDSFDENSFEFDSEQFNNGVIDAFSAFNSVIVEPAQSASDIGKSMRAGELRQSKFYVITGSAYEENSLTSMIDGIWGGVLTRGIAAGMGCSYPDGKYSGSMAADIDNDGNISFGELSNYCKLYSGDRQNVLSYSSSPNCIIFERK